MIGGTDASYDFDVFLHGASLARFTTVPDVSHNETSAHASDLNFCIWAKFMSACNNWVHSQRRKALFE